MHINSKNCYYQQALLRGSNFRCHSRAGGNPEKHQKFILNLFQDLLQKMLNQVQHDKEFLDSCFRRNNIILLLSIHATTLEAPGHDGSGSRITKSLASGSIVKRSLNKFWMTGSIVL